MISWELKNWVIVKINQKIKGIEAVLNRPEKYAIKNEGKMREALVRWKRFLEWLQSVPTNEGIEYAEEVVGLKKEPSELEKKLKELETKVGNIEIIVKKLVAYHKGEV